MLYHLAEILFLLIQQAFGVSPTGSVPWRYSHTFKSYDCKASINPGECPSPVFEDPRDGPYSNWYGCNGTGVCTRPASSSRTQRSSRDPQPCTPDRRARTQFGHAHRACLLHVRRSLSTAHPCTLEGGFYIYENMTERLYPRLFPKGLSIWMTNWRNLQTA